MHRIANQKAREFADDLQWLNTTEALSLAKLRGHIVVLDFWTYCCINCMHMLPELAKIEKKYVDKPLMVVGVHSAKFYNEQNPENIMEAIKRYEIEHPVVIDKNMKIWQSYGVSGWPTFIIIDPMGNVVYKASGEGQRENIEDVIDVLLERYGKLGMLAKDPIRIDRVKSVDNTVLSYPGKIAFPSDGKMLAISDSNHNRILIVDLTGRIRYVIGNGTRGYKDGSFDDASFFRPQGVAWYEDRIYVADTENHTLRAIDLATKQVTTLAGTGRQGHWMQGGGLGRSTSLSSPWDLAYRDGRIYIAMAGSHQIWMYDTRSENIGPFAGSGYENIVDADNLYDAQFAQPSGLSLYENYLYVADSEVSAVRRIDLGRNIVRTLVGAGLFIFGYKDGNVSKALLQHPLGVHADGNNIYVADTYNHAIRVINVDSGYVNTLVGRAEMNTMCKTDDSNCDTLGLFEPSDVKLHDNKLYISDTNNHLIRTFDLEKRVLNTLKIRG
ncbi:MAG: thioredoxin-like domain-containing protein [Nitrososphaerales archaeon]